MLFLLSAEVSLLDFAPVPVAVLDGRVSSRAVSLQAGVPIDKVNRDAIKNFDISILRQTVRASSVPLIGKACL